MATFDGTSARRNAVAQPTFDKRTGGRRARIRRDEGRATTLSAWRPAPLATTSAAALLMGEMRSAEAACAFANTAPVNNTIPNNCITVNNGAAFTGNLTNSSTLTPPALTTNAAGSATGISVLNSTTLNGSMQNSGTISDSASPRIFGLSVRGGSTLTHRTACPLLAILVTAVSFQPQLYYKHVT